MARKTEKHEIRMLNCDGQLKGDENWMSTETSWVRDVARGQRGMTDNEYSSHETAVARSISDPLRFGCSTSRT